MKSALAKKYSLDYLDNYQKSIIFAAQMMSNLKILIGMSEAKRRFDELNDEQL